MESIRAIPGTVSPRVAIRTPGPRGLPSRREYLERSSPQRFVGLVSGADEGALGAIEPVTVISARRAETLGLKGPRTPHLTMRP